VVRYHPMNKSLIIEQISVNVDGKQVVDKLSLEVKSGSLHVLMGPNGSGKSSLAYALAGHPEYEIEKNGVGRLSLNGADLLTLSADERARAGLFLAFQYPVAIPGLLVWKFLYEAYKLQHGGQDRLRALAFKQWLQKLAIDYSVKVELLERSLNEGFSGGEKKKLEILQMAVLAPRFAIIDEVDSGLDLDAVKEVAAGIERIRKQHGTGILLITHYQRLLKYLQVDWVHVMMKGRLVAQGGQEVLDRLEERGYKGF